MGAFGESRKDGHLKTQKNVQSVTKMAGNGSGGIEINSGSNADQSLKLRLFVGGLGPTVGPADLQERFALLGKVHKIEMVEGKEWWDEGALHRGFAYVEFEALSDARLRKLFSAYNGCKWKGGVLRVEKAKEHYTDRLRREWAEAEAEAAARAVAASQVNSSPRLRNTTVNAGVRKGSNTVRIELEKSYGEQDDQVDDVAAQVAKERKRQFDLLSKLFPEDNDIEEKDKAIEMLNISRTSNAGTKKRKKYEDADVDLHVIEPNASSESEMNGDSESSLEDFADAEGVPNSLTSSPMSDASIASKWEKMFKSAKTVVDTVQGMFSGSLDETDVPVKARSSMSREKVFGSAALNQVGSVIEAANVPEEIAATEEEKVDTSFEDFTNNDNCQEAEINDDTAASGGKEDSADDQQIGSNETGNVLARFNMEQDESEPSSSHQFVGTQILGDPQHVGSGAGKEKAEELGLGMPTSQQLERRIGVDDTKWVQRASWKSLVGADGRVAFSLKELTGEHDLRKAATGVKKSETNDVAEKSFTFNFNIVRTQPETSLAESAPSKVINNEKMSIKARKIASPSLTLIESDKPGKVTAVEDGCPFMKSSNAEQEWRASKSELRMDSKAKHKTAMRTMKKMRGSGGAR